MAPAPEQTPRLLTLEKIGGFAHNGGASSAEITTYDPLSKRLFVVNGANASVDVLDISNPTLRTLVGSLTALSLAPGLANVNSVAVFNGVVALAVESSVKTDNGTVVWVRARDLAVLGSDTGGALPDMVTFTPDGNHLLVANEGEPNSYGQPDSVDPVGSVSMIAMSGASRSATTATLLRTVSTTGFDRFNGQIAAFRSSGVRIFGPGANVAQDLEPECIAVSADSHTAYATLQDTDAVAVIDIASQAVTVIKPLAFKEHSQAGVGMDVSKEDGGLNTDSGTPVAKSQPLPVKSSYHA